MTQPRLLGSRYELGRTLGYGGMAEVHLGRDVRLGRDVAVKVLRPDLARDPSFQARFRREAQAAASLNHPAIVAVYDSGEDLDQGGGAAGPVGPTPYIVMEYVEGRTLRDILKSEGPLHPQRAMEIVADICAALDYSHRNGIVHRDMKPGNVMVTRSGAVKVMDFGIARAITDSAATVTSTAAVIGTAQYLSPEQARGESVDARSDVYSTGCLLYELLTGHPPFTGDSPVAVAYQHVRENPIPPSQVNRDVPRHLDAIVLKAMAKNPVNRYQSGADMRADLVRAISGRPVQATPVMSDEEHTTVLGGPIRHQPPPPVPGPPTAMQQPVQEPNRRAAFILLGVGVVVVFVVAALVVSQLLGNGKKTVRVDVPQVIGLTKQQAAAKLSAAHLKLGTTNFEASAAKDKNKVVAQQPGQGVPLIEGSQVDITVGQGPETVAVPSVKGMTYDAAASLLNSQGLTPARQDKDSSEPEGTVLGSSPDTGQQVAKEQTVTVFVSNGMTRVPSVIGQTSDQAIDTLTKAGFTNVKPVDQQRSDVPEFQVFAQDPPGGTTAKPGDEIQIFVAVAPATPTPTPTPTLTPTLTPTPTPTDTTPNPDGHHLPIRRP
ncbi:MAG TPA: Stk1 family PASTA domain-containing Ser/Thr kinase [Mycobacteriales bacterium]|nr:Stk1 family PASTA domain-containing Ser/Thr kinase [Mycobacteriales bacterium]